MAQDVFISYSHKDKAIADAICANLESARVRCWIAPRDIAPGLDWPTAISKAIEASRIMVLVFSAHSNASNDVGRELILAANNNLVIIPFKIDNVQPEPGKQYYLARTHWLDAMNPPTQEQINTLVSHVKVFLRELEAGKTIEPERAGKTSEVSETSEVSQAPETARVKKQVKLNSLWIWGALLLLALLAGGIYAVRLFWAAAQPAPPTLTPSLMPAPTQTHTPTFAPSSTTTPTRTVRTTATATPAPAWVTDFAGPILAAVARVSPTFQDDFGPSSGGWQSEAWCGNNIAYVQGELVITECRAWRPNINYNDFVIEFDMRFLPGAGPGERFGFSFKDISGIGDGHSVSIKPNGGGWINYQSGNRPTDDTLFNFQYAALPDLRYNHFLVIGKGAGFAIYLNNKPLYYFETSIRSFGNFGFNAASTIAAIDNLNVWNLGNILIP
jgi:hypothetical protein